MCKYIKKLYTNNPTGVYTHSEGVILPITVARAHYCKTELPKANADTGLDGLGQNGSHFETISILDNINDL